jgi:hypothetical protein
MKTACRDALVYKLKAAHQSQHTQILHLSDLAGFSGALRRRNPHQSLARDARQALVQDMSTESTISTIMRLF